MRIFPISNSFQLLLRLCMTALATKTCIISFYALLLISCHKSHSSLYSDTFCHLDNALHSAAADAGKICMKATLTNMEDT